MPSVPTAIGTAAFFASISGAVVGWVVGGIISTRFDLGAVGFLCAMVQLPLVGGMVTGAVPTVGLVLIYRSVPVNPDTTWVRHHRRFWASVCFTASLVLWSAVVFAAVHRL